ncbi:MAG: putative LPS assembly protein LptD [Longimicrobiales bacterium]
MQRAVLACGVAVCVWTAPALAQIPTQQDTTVKSPLEQMRARLRSLRPIGAPDSVPVGDSLRAPAQQIRVNGMADPRDARAGQSPALTRDSIWEALVRLPGFNATEYKSDTAAFRADSGNLNLRGNALVSRDGQQVEAGAITYSDSISLVCGYGKPRVSGTGTATPLESDSLCYDIERRYGVARGATTSISEGALWRMYSTTLVTRGDDYYSNGATFTDCDLPWDHLHYAFSAKKVLAKRNNILVARDVTLRFADVPVFWLPFMVQSLSQGRRSGVLMPRFGVNDIARTSQRYSRRIEDVGFYWAINDFMGSEVAFGWMSNNWTELRSSFDYNYLDKFIRGGATLRRFWKSEGGTELTVASRNSWEPNERTRMSADVNYSTSSSFVKRNTFDPRELNRSIDSNFSMNRRFDWASLTFGSSRRQFLTDNTVTQVFPSLALNLSSVTLFQPTGAETKWYNNATLSGSAEGRRDGTTIGDASTSPSAQSRHGTNASVRGSFTLGKFSLNQSFTVNDARTDERTIPLVTVDSVRVLPGSAERSNRWGVDLSFQQRLVGTSTISPRLGLSGESLRNDKTQNQTLASPTQLTFGVGTQVDMYRILATPVGPFAALRHKFSPGVSYNYSPKPKADSLQSAVFGGVANKLEQNNLSFSLNQTFEAKYKDSRDSSQISAAESAVDTATGPRPSQNVRTVQLLSISTSAVAYDFVQAREFGTGIQATTITNDFHSDLLQGFQFGIVHDLFRPVTRTDGEPATVADRVFDPRLTNVNASFGISGNSWLFRILHLGKRDSMPVGRGELGNPALAAQAGVAVDRTQEEFGMVGTRRRNAIGTQSGAVGSWTANLRYSLVRPRSTSTTEFNNTLYRPAISGQQVTGTLNFQPTANWTAAWETGYSITDGRFSDHNLMLTRKLHDWDANFVFVKAQNGNFSFQFNVALRANPDIKLDWSQNDIANPTTSRFR